MASEASHSRFSFRGDVARAYDRFNAWASLGMDRLWRRRTAEMIAADLAPGPNPQPILDLACGTMDMALAVAKSLPKNIILGSDVEIEMLRIGREKIRERGGDIHPLIAAARHPFPDLTFAAVSCAFGIRNFTDIPGTLAEINRLLRPGGRVYILEFFRPPNRFSRIFLSFLRMTVFPLVGLILTGKTGPYQYLAESIELFLTSAEMKQSLLEVGLEPCAERWFCLGLVQLVIAQKPG